MRSQGWGPHDGISVLIEETPENLLALSPSPPCEVIVRRQPAASEEESPPPKLGLPATLSWTLQPPELHERNVCGLSDPICGMLL